MITQSEAQLEAAVVEQLSAAGWERVSIKGPEDLWANLRRQVEAHNADVLGRAFTDAEWLQVRTHLERGSILDKAEALRARFAVRHENGEATSIRFFNSEEWCRNRYQVATQITVKEGVHNRYDVTLLVNGLPLCHIELKKPSMALAAAFKQIGRYQKETFRVAGGLFQFVQIFVVSNGVNTRYFANNPGQSFKQTFTWSGPDNQAINRLSDFTDAFLEKCHLSKMIARYVTRQHVERVMMVLRPYQYHAAEAITHAVTHRTGDGFIWHTTGSGKTLTSFKAAQNICALPKIEKVVFVVDRQDLDSQTTREFNAYRPESVDQTRNTRSLVAQLANPSPERKLVVTTIQKLNAALSGQRYERELETVLEGRVVFIFDECHRSQFGETHRRIRRSFTNAQMFGFTGTPIFDENAVGGRTTKELFGGREALHTYVITDAIQDRNVLPFSVEYQRTTEVDVAGKSPSEAKTLLEHPRRIRRVVEWIVAHHAGKTRGGEFAAMLAVGSVDALIAYYNVFEELRAAGAHDLRIATIFSTDDNEADPDADGFFGDDEETAVSTATKRDRLAEYVAAYNARYGVNNGVKDQQTFKTYREDISERMKARDKRGFDPAEGIDILLVVDMFLTGFDVRTLGAIYVDKNLKQHGLVQAFSRTNRVLNETKSQGNVVCFRDLRKEVDDAIALFADRNATSTILIGCYADHLAAHRRAVEALLAITPTVDAVDRLVGEAAQARFAKAFREVARARNVMVTFNEHKPEDLVKPGFGHQDFKEFRSKYVDLANDGRKSADGDEPGELGEMDFEIELITRVDINVDYIIGLLERLRRHIHEAGSDSPKAEKARRRLYDTLSSEPQFRHNRDVIRDFAENELATLGSDGDVRKAFDAYRDRLRAEAYSGLARTENLDEARLNEIVGRMKYDGKRPTATQIVGAMNVKPGAIMRREITTRIISRIEEIEDAYDEEAGERP